MIKLKHLIKEEKGDLLALVGKDEDDDLTTSDMASIGRKVADMEGEELQSYLSMIKALGGYYGGRGDGKETLDDLRIAGIEAYNKAKEQQNEQIVEGIDSKKVKVFLTDVESLLYDIMTECDCRHYNEIKKMLREIELFINTN